MRVFGWQTRARNESEGFSFEAEVGTLFYFMEGVHHRPIMILGERFEFEHICWDPKDGELCLNRVKPGETLVEARSDSDVQIDRRIWV